VTGTSPAGADGTAAHRAGVPGSSPAGAGGTAGPDAPGGLDPDDGTALPTLPAAVVCASANPKKAAELAEVLGGLRVTVLPRPADVPEVAEDADTFLGNARLKAAALARATGRPALADDSGLEVDALAGAPGVHSARYAGPDGDDARNVARLLAALAEVPATERGARFRSVVVLRWPDGREVHAEGTVAGRIVPVPTGSGGFGYDPVFVPDDGDGRTFAEMAPAEKHRLSHRGRALRALVDALSAPPHEEG
jgi:XTP/dITP diphosphohydrolase